MVIWKRLVHCYTNFLNVTIFHYIPSKKKSQWVTIPTDLIRSLKSIGKLSFLSAATNTVSGLPWPNSSLLRMSAKYSNLNNHNLSVTISSKKSSMKKAVVQVATQTTAFPPDNHHTLVHKKCHMHISHFISQNIKKVYAHGSEFSNFYFFIRHF